MTVMGLDAPLDTSLYGGTTQASNDVPGRMECSLDGHSYRIDRAADLNGFRQEHHARRTIPVLRSQADIGLVPSEQSINREGLWRRSQETWDHGAGQTYLDRQNSDGARFLSSKGVNVWNKNLLSLLPDTTSIRSSANTNLSLVSVGTYTYLIDGQTLLYTASLTSPSFVTVTGTPAVAATAITTDGYTVYVSYGASGVYTTTRGAATAATYNALTAAQLAYVKGRLMASVGNSIYNITSTATPTALLTQGNTDFQWVGFAEGPSYIYAAGYSGGKSLIYKIGLTTDATALSAPVVAGELPTGETVRSVRGYLGLLIVGTDLGVRIASLSSSGDLTLGSLIPTTSPVLALAAADRFVWYGLTNYDTTSTGLGRLDLTTFTLPLTPAYASDSMATAQGAVLSVLAGTVRTFAVSGAGVFTESTSLVTSGSLTTGRIAYGVGDDKVAMYLDLRHEPLKGTVGASFSANGGTAFSVGTSNVAGSTSNPYPLSTQQSRAEFYSITLTLTRDAVVTSGPVVTRYTLHAYPAPTRSFQITVPLILHNTQVDLNGAEFAMDVNAERLFLEGLFRTQKLFTYQEAGLAYQVLLDDFTWIPIKLSGEAVEHNSYDGTFVCLMKEVSS